MFRDFLIINSNKIYDPLSPNFSMDIASKGYQILKSKGPVSLARKGSHFAFGELYWSVHDQYSLSINDTEVIFSAPTRTAVNWNKKRFTTEHDVIRELLEELEEDDIFYDIGANTGLYTLFAAHNCSEVFAFEPYPANVSSLKENISRNNAYNVKICDIVLSDSNGYVSFNQPQQDLIGYGSASIATDGTKATVKVAAKAGDNLISSENLPIPNVMKIDVEGSEPLVVDGLEQTLSDSTCRLVYCEVHISETDQHPSIEDFNLELDDIKNKFRKCGFTVDEIIEARGSEVFLKCSK